VKGKVMSSKNKAALALLLAAGALAVIAGRGELTRPTANPRADTSMVAAAHVQPRVGSKRQRTESHTPARAVDGPLPEATNMTALAPPRSLSPRSLSDRAVLWGAVCLVLGASGFLFFSRSTPKAGSAPVPRTPSLEETLPFGFRRKGIVRNVGGPVFAHPSQAPLILSIPQGMALAPAPLPVPSTPAPVGPPRKLTLPGGAAIARSTTGQVFGRYNLLDRLGQGGMADVFTAVAHGVEGFTRVFVLKRLRPELSHDKQAVAQFIDEARMQSNLVHSNIVPVFDFGRVGTEYFMTQEYIVGRDLVRLIARYYDHAGHTIPCRLAYYIAHETLQALQYAHRKRDREGQHLGVVHRDVSAGNILVSAEGEIKLADFGIVKFNRRKTQTQTGMVKGNANFMSPEQARGQPVDARSDLFSVALVLYYCLTNRLLYDGDNDLDVLHKAASGPRIEDYEAIGRLAAPANAVLARALATDPANRFQSAEEFAEALAPHIAGAKAEAARLMQTLFGDELQKEAA
jgi:Protein kinase domain